MNTLKELYNKEIKPELKNKFINDYPYLTKAINYGTGIRILKQDPFETIIGFIILILSY